jgi:serine phosphatase RsbU (regulator of sigma subunit)
VFVMERSEMSVARNLAAIVVAGDFYDVFTLADGTLGLAVGDVAGKGMGASLVMASVKGMLPLVAAERRPAAALEELNRRLAAQLPERQFVALCLVFFDPGSGRLEIANAGLPDPYVLRAGGHAAALQVSGHDCR